MLKKINSIFFVALLILFADISFADIYKYTDSNGISYFTNVPTSSEYKLYIKERLKKNTPPAAGTRKYDGIIRKAQKKYGVEFSLIKAIIKVESGFNSKAVSKKGAKGLMQIIPSNFKSLSVEDPFNPSQNIMAGALYLKRLLNRYEKKLPLVIAAYNAGPNAVDRYRQIPPYKETQNYVKKVIKAYNGYKDS